MCSTQVFLLFLLYVFGFLFVILWRAVCVKTNFIFTNFSRIFRAAARRRIFRATNLSDEFFRATTFQSDEFSERRFICATN